MYLKWKIIRITEKTNNNGFVCPFDELKLITFKRKHPFEFGVYIALITMKHLQPQNDLSSVLLS